MAAAAAAAGADRIFMMGYDYHWAGSDPGASAPMDRRDGKPQDLAWSLDLYAVAGVPVQRTILGLPFYGMAWPVAGPELGDPDTGRGDTWIPSDHLFDATTTRRFTPTLDPIEQVEFYAIADPGRRGRLAGDLRRFARDAHAQAGPRGRSRPRRRGVLGDRLRAWPAGYADLVKRFADGKLD